MNRAVRIAVLVTVAAAAFCGVSHGQEGPAAGRLVVLDTAGFWRLHLAMRTPAVRNGDALTKIGAPCDTPAPPTDWTSTTFDDSGWVRAAGAPFDAWSHWEQVARANVGFIYCHNSSMALAQISLRGKFRVDDPAKVGDMKLSVTYRGGLAVLLNGKEIARSHLPKEGALSPDLPADMYPREAYFLEDGDLPEGYGRKGSKSERLLLHLRTVEIAIPSDALVKGANVLALSIHRSPLSAEAWEALKKKDKNQLTFFLWDACGLHSARLDCAAGGALRSNATRPAGVQAWNSSVMWPDTDVDWGDPNEPLRPVRIVGTPGGAFSGKVVVGSDKPLKNLRAQMTDFEGPAGAKIASSSARIRFGVPDLPRRAVDVNRLDSLVETPPAEVPVRRKDPRSSGLRTLPGQPEAVCGAVASVWATVNVPRDAKPGDYSGTLVIRAEGADVAVPVELSVSGFTLPEPVDYKTFVELAQSPDTLAAEYGVEPWSEAHWKLVAKSLKLAGEAGAATCYIPLICETNLGNGQSMVRWTRQADGSYRFDFSVMEKYLDLVEKEQGRPDVVCFNVWDTFLEGGQFADHVERLEGKKVHDERFDYQGKGPEVTVVEGGKLSKLLLPQYSEAKAKALWEPLAKELMDRMKKRGLDKAMTLGLATDAQPTAAVVELWKELLPGVPWASQAHPYREKIHGEPVAFTCAVWAPRFIDYGGTSRQGWKTPRLMAQFARDVVETNPITVFRLIGEMNVGGDQRGFGRWGADFWPVLKDRRGGYAGRIYERFPKANWRNLNIKVAFLGPGPDGPVATVRFEALREGVQECEARIFIEQALEGGRLPPQLAARCRELIDERNRAIVMGLSSHTVEGFQDAGAYWRVHDWHTRSGSVGYTWYQVSGWQERSKKLYDLAAEVAAAIAK